MERIMNMMCKVRKIEYKEDEKEKTKNNSKMEGNIS